MSNALPTPTPLNSEKVWTGDFWCNCILLIFPNYKNNIFLIFLFCLYLSILNVFLWFQDFGIFVGIFLILWIFFFWRFLWSLLLSFDVSLFICTLFLFPFKVTRITGGRKHSNKKQNTTLKGFYSQKGKKNLGWSPPEELEVGLRSRAYLLVRILDRVAPLILDPPLTSSFTFSDFFLD